MYFQQEKQRQEAEASKKQRKPGQKRRGLGGLSKEKKRMLKVIFVTPLLDHHMELSFYSLFT